MTEEHFDKDARPMTVKSTLTRTDARPMTVKSTLTRTPD